ncbi:acetyl-CoA acetyltransferase [Nakamurella sp. GG22]
MNAFDDLAPTTPVLIGVGQSSDPLDAPDYHRWSAVDLAAAAAAAAIADAGCDPALIDTIAGVRQFEISGDFFTAPLGRSDNYPRSVARRVGADPHRAVLEVVGGQSSQHLVTEFATAIGRGDAQMVLVVGSEAISTTRAWAGKPDAPDFTENTDGDLEDRGYGMEGLIDEAQIAHGLTDAPSQYALLENARRRRTGKSRAEYATEMGELFAPFTTVAAANPFAAAPVERSAAELVTVTERNRMITDPYPRFVVARDQVNQGAAVLLSSVGAARAAGVPESKWVFLHGYSDLRELPLLERADLSTGPASIAAARTALQRTEIGTEDLSFLDLYSCFPIPVLNICDGLGLSHTDPRGLTVTGGLPFFGGAGNNYSMHGIAEVVGRLRSQPGTYGFVGANGGVMSKYSAAVYSTTPRAWTEWSDADRQAELDAVAGPGVSTSADGEATIETYTVKYDRSGTTGIVVGRLGDDTRFLGTTVPGDDATMQLLLSDNPFGATVWVARQGPRNVVAIDRATLAALST